MNPSSKPVALPHISPWILKGFTWYARRYVRSHFRTIRVLRSGPMPDVADRPTVVYLNHASWWDPLIGLLLARSFQPRRASYVPIEASMLERYRFFRKLGCFGVERGTFRGSRNFVRTADRILAERNALLWITPQGRFADARERPVGFEEGVGLLASRQLQTAFVPLSLEYVFWSEPRPEVLVSFGQPTIPQDRPPQSGKAWTQFFAESLRVEQDRLAHAAIRRQPDDWATIDQGKAGVHVVYDLWRRVKALISGKRFSPGHAGEEKP